MYHKEDIYTVSVYSYGVLLKEYNSVIIDDFSDHRCIIKRPFPDDPKILQEIVIDNATIIAEQCI